MFMIKKQQMMMAQEKKVLKTPVENNDFDRISNLPDTLLCHILSLLPTKESAATSILSTRWKYLFAYVPHIDLEFIHNAPSCDGNAHTNVIEDACDWPFLNFIKLGNKMVLLRNGAPLRKFKVSLWRIDERFHLIFDSLISAALLCQAQEVEVFVEHLNYSTRDCNPEIFTCQTLISLKLNWRKAACSGLPNSLSLPNLKVLELDFLVSMDECSVRRLIQGCPVLEVLFLVFTCFRTDNRVKKTVDVLDFSSPSMKKLKLDYWGGEEGTKIVVGSNNLESLDYRVRVDDNEPIIINAPNLKHLSCEALVAGLMNFIENLNCLIEAKITVKGVIPQRSQDVIVHLLRVQSVKSLCVGDRILEALHDSQHLLPTFKNLLLLELEFDQDDDDIDHMLAWKTLPSLLENAPKLETLVFDHVIWDNIEEDEGFESLLLDIFPIRIIERLKEIEIKAFNNQEHEFKLVEYLLQNGKELKKIAVGGELLQPSSCRRILSFNRSNEYCQIVLR